MTPGYFGGFLEVDLTTGRSAWRPLGDSLLRRYLGGVGLGAKLLLDRGSAREEPLSAESAVAFVFSPLVGSPLTTSAKFAVVARSPLTLRLNDSLVSSGFALAGKRAAGDALLVTGAARRPSVLVVDDRQARLEPADDLWGLEIGAAEAEIKRRYPGGKAAVIGPAGERGVRYATVSHDGRHAGRGGHGAVLGAKRVKAIVVRGRRRCDWARPEKLVDYARRLSAASMGPATEKYRELGTASNLLAFNRLRVLPTRNFQEASFEGAEALAPESLAHERGRVRQSCAACTIGCEHLYGLRSGNSVRVEYESLFALGPLCGVDDSDAVLRASRRCDQLGMDTISAGGSIAFAMECAERGLFGASGEDEAQAACDRLSLRFGNGAAMLQAIEQTARRQGVGDWLAEGSRLMAQRLDAGLGRPASVEFAPQVKGLELPGYEPRGMQAMALGFAVGSRGADHNRSGAYQVDFSSRVDRRNFQRRHVRDVVETENRAALMDSLILCKFLRAALVDFYGESAEMLRLTTGWDVTPEELRGVAERIIDTKKRFNQEAGWTQAEDTLPARMLRQSPADAPESTLDADRLNELVQAYYAARGWTADGRVDER